MIHSESCESATKKGLKLDKSLDLPRSQNKTTPCQTHPAEPIDDALASKSKKFEKVEKPQESSQGKKTPTKVLKKNINSERQKKQIAEVSEGEKVHCNLKTDGRKSENAGHREESSKVSTKPNSVDTPKEHKQIGKGEKGSSPESSTETIDKHQVDITMSNEEKLQNMSKVCEAPRTQEEIKGKGPKGGSEHIGKQEFVKDSNLLNQLRSLVSNPTPGLNISRLSNHIEAYRRTQEKEISLAATAGDPLIHEDLKEGILRARLVKLQTDKKEKLCPTIFNSTGMDAPPRTKSKSAKSKSFKGDPKSKNQNSTLKSRNDLSSDEKDCNSQSSITSNSGSKAHLGLKNKRSSPDSKYSVKNAQYTDENTVNNDYFEGQITSLEPKDVSDRTLNAFETYLAQVSSMYFRSSPPEPTETLNEVSSRLSNNQNELLSGRKGFQMDGESEVSEVGSSLVSNDFHYSTLDMLCNPLRVPHVFERWSPLEISIFETCICKFGTKFDSFSKFIKTKTTREVTEFYFCWKNTSHYRTWKQKMESCTLKDRNDWVFTK